MEKLEQKMMKTEASFIAFTFIVCWSSIWNELDESGQILPSIGEFD